ncbi:MULTISPECIES: ArsR/SmtB family transcription factor [unclassified Aureimonas]|uniref:ArsR/SmtB family transcription factor n=1 Tax=Aureimonas sp. Leaf427 TaxID=1736375 RepID=UPI0006FB2465|nr:transcriptional regulator [Aureimonas sp. Leaf427]KQT75990.1 transcriptional regulator [Aureimonas sp. Leaf460]
MKLDEFGTENLQAFEDKAGEVAAILKAVANERRLMLLCKLVEWGEGSVGTLAEAVGLSQSALSQHLTVLREKGIVAYRREGQTLWYRVCDPRIEALFATLHGLFCPPPLHPPAEAARPPAPVPAETKPRARENARAQNEDR